MAKNFKRSNLSFFLLNGFAYASYCSLFTFTLTILLEYNFTTIECGIITTAQSIVLMCVLPLYGYIMDNFISAKKTTIIIFVCGLIATLPLPITLKMSFPVVLLHFIILSFFIFCSGAILDTWAVEIINKTRGMDYAIVRGGGSVFYAVASFFCGLVIVPFGVEAIIFIHIVCTVCTIILACYLPDSQKVDSDFPEMESEEKSAQKVNFLQAAKYLFGNKDFVRLLICVCLFLFALRPTSTYLPILLNNVGGDGTVFGISQFISALFEAVVMIFVTQFIARGMSKELCLSLGWGILAIRMMIFFVTDNIYIILFTQIIQSIGYGLQLRAYAEYTVSIVERKYRATAITLLASISNGVGTVFGNYIGAELIDRLGALTFTAICTVIMVMASLLFIPPTVKAIRKRRAEVYSNLIQNNKI